MGHLLSTRESRFHLSHGTQALLLSQLEDLDAGREISYYYRKNKNNGGNENKSTSWPDSFADNYLH